MVPGASPESVVWESFLLECLLREVDVRPEKISPWRSIRDLLKSWDECWQRHETAKHPLDHQTEMPPVSPDLLFSLDKSARRCTRYPGLQEYIRTQSQRQYDLSSYFWPWIQNFVHQYIWPECNFILFETAVNDYQRQFLERRPAERVYLSQTEKEEIREDWARRLDWPGRQMGWQIETSENADRPWRDVDSLEREVDLFWNRCERILDRLEPLRPLKGILLDQIRRYLSWHLVLVSWQNAIAVPVFPALFAPSGGGVQWLGYQGKSDSVLSIGTRFQNEAGKAHRVGVDAWIARNRRWRLGEVERASDGTPLEHLWSSTLALDVRPLRATFEAALKVAYGEEHNECLRFADRSAGLSIAVGVMGLLSGYIPNAGVWCTGPIDRVILDRYERRRPTFDGYTKSSDEQFYEAETELGNWVDGAVQAYDAIPRWPSESPGLERDLEKKLRAAKTHGIAGRVVSPESATLTKVISDFQQNKTGLGFHPVSTDRLSVAADAALPLTFRKHRFVNTPDLRWAFGEKYEQRWVDASKEQGGKILEALKEDSVTVVVGQQASGKSYAIATALALARRQLTDEETKRTNARIAFVRIPDVGLDRFWTQSPSERLWEEDAWSFLLTHLAFPQASIAAFNNAENWKRKAAVFVDAFRAFGPDILVLDGIERFYQWNDRGISSMRTQHFAKVLDEIRNLLQKQPVSRDEKVGGVLGSCELILERRTLPRDDSWNVVHVEQPRWDPQQALEAVRSTVESGYRHAEKINSALGALSVFKGSFTTKGLYLVAQHLTKREICTEEELETIVWPALKQIRLVREVGGDYLAVSDATNSPVKFFTSQDSGPLLRESHGRFHVHPILREPVHRAWVSSLVNAESWSGRRSLCHLYIRVATEYYTPFIFARPGTGHIITEALLPEHRMWSRSVLYDAVQLIHTTPDSSKLAETLQQILEAGVLLTKYYSNPSYGRTAALLGHKRIKGKHESSLFDAAFRNIEEIMVAHEGEPHPQWSLKAAEMLEDQGSVFFRNDIVDRFETADRMYVAAMGSLEKLSADERRLMEQKILGQLAGYLFKYGRSIREMPHGYQNEEQVLLTWEENVLNLRGADKLVFREMTPVPLDVFCVVGDAYWRRKQRQKARNTYLLGMNQQRASGRNQMFVLTARVLGAVAQTIIQQTIDKRKRETEFRQKKIGGSDFLYIHQEWSEARRAILRKGSKHNPRKAGNEVLSEMIRYVDEIIPPSR